MDRHRPWMAFVLNFVVPGAGLVYLGRWWQGIANAVLVLGILLALFFGYGESALVEHIHWVFLALMAASGGYAHGVAQTLNKSAETKMPLAH